MRVNGSAWVGILTSLALSALWVRLGSGSSRYDEAHRQAWRAIVFAYPCGEITISSPVKIEQIHAYL